MNLNLFPIINQYGNKKTQILKKNILRNKFHHNFPISKFLVCVWVLTEGKLSPQTQKTLFEFCVKSFCHLNFWCYNGRQTANSSTLLEFSTRVIVSLKRSVEWETDRLETCKTVICFCLVIKIFHDNNFCFLYRQNVKFQCRIILKISYYL